MIGILTQHKKECPDFEIVRYKRPYTKKLSEVTDHLNIKKLGYEINGVTMAMFNRFGMGIPRRLRR
jgi:hypothetical protein